MKMILDAFGGDHAPLEPILGARQAIDEYGVEVILCGMREKIEQTAKWHEISLDGIEIAEASSVIPVEEEPGEILKKYNDCSMAVGMKLLYEGKGDAFISAGSTGALVMGSALIVKRVKGVKRPAIGTVVPCEGGNFMLMDAGANAECRPEMLQQFGIMGAAYMHGVMGVENPRVGLVNIGTEDNKGLDLQIEANRLLKTSPLNYIGNIEARAVPLGGCDVAVCDGFVGNVMLKTIEGMGKLMGNMIKGMLMKNVGTKMAALMLKGGINDFRKKMDYSEHGGALLMGIAKPVVKAHGSSDAKAFKNAIRQAKLVCEKDIIGQIQESIGKIKAQGGGESI